MLKEKMSSTLMIFFINEENIIVIGVKGVLLTTCVLSPNIHTLPSIGAHIIEEVWCF